MKTLKLESLSTQSRQQLVLESLTDEINTKKCFQHLSVVFRERNDKILNSVTAKVRMQVCFPWIFPCEVENWRTIYNVFFYYLTVPLTTLLPRYCSTEVVREGSKKKTLFLTRGKFTNKKISSISLYMEINPLSKEIHYSCK